MLSSPCLRFEFHRLAWHATVFGHGIVSSRDEVQELLDVTLEVRDRVSKLVREGKSFEEIVEARPTADLDARWGSRLDRFLPGVYLGIVTDR